MLFRSRQAPQPDLALSKQDIDEQAQLANDILLEIEGEDFGLAERLEAGPEYVGDPETSDAPGFAGREDDNNLGAAEPT